MIFLSLVKKGISSLLRFTSNVTVNIPKFALLTYYKHVRELSQAIVTLILNVSVWTVQNRFFHM
jgi:hypothetical protein